MGIREFLKNRGRSDFYFGFVPTKNFESVFESYDLYIVRGDIALEDGLIVDDAWLANPKKDGTPRKSIVIIIKDIKREPHREIWEKWTGRFKDGWEWLP